MGKIKAGRVLLTINCYVSFISAGLFSLIGLVLLTLRQNASSELLKIYNIYLIVFACSIVVLLISGFLSLFFKENLNKKNIVCCIVFGFVFGIILMIVGGFLLNAALNENAGGSLNDKIDDSKEQIIILSRDQNKLYKSSRLREYVNSWKKKSVGERITLIIMLIIFIIYGFSLVFPLIWAFYNSFKHPVEYDHNSFALPLNWTVENYEKVFTTVQTNGTNIFTSLINSIWMSALSTFLGLFASCLTAYVVAKYKFKASGLIYTIAIFIQIIPLVGSITGTYDLLWGKLQIADEPFLIWPIWFGGFGFSFLILYSAFKSVSWSYAESAFIDGAGHFTTFLKIMLPSVKPILASLFVVTFMGAWNDYMTAYLYMPSYAPLSLAVYLLQSDATRIAYPVYLAVIVISVVPILALFISFQKLIMENTSIGGLKG